MHTKMKYFMGEVGVSSEERARALAEKAGQMISGLGGSIDVGRSFGEAPDFLIVTLPEDSKATPEELVGLEEGITFHQVHMAQYPAQQDHGIQ